MSWEDTLKEQAPDPEKIVGYKTMNGFRMPLNAYGNVPVSEHQKILDSLEELKAQKKMLEAKIKEMES